ncbi:hypothetical protein JCM10213_000422 [Rhodosporidiobolus nylandii]
MYSPPSSPSPSTPTPSHRRAALPGDTLQAAFAMMELGTTGKRSVEALERENFELTWRAQDAARRAAREHRRLELVGERLRHENRSLENLLRQQAGVSLEAARGIDELAAGLADATNRLAALLFAALEQPLSGEAVAQQFRDILRPAALELPRSVAVVAALRQLAASSPGWRGTERMSCPAPDPAAGPDAAPAPIENRRRRSSSEQDGPAKKGPKVDTPTPQAGTVGGRAKKKRKVERVERLFAADKPQSQPMPPTPQEDVSEAEGAVGGPGPSSAAGRQTPVKPTPAGPAAAETDDGTIAPFGLPGLSAKAATSPAAAERSPAIVRHTTSSAGTSASPEAAGTVAGARVTAGSGPSSLTYEELAQQAASFETERDSALAALDAKDADLSSVRSELKRVKSELVDTKKHLTREADNVAELKRDVALYEQLDTPLSTLGQYIVTTGVAFHRASEKALADVDKEGATLPRRRVVEILGTMSSAVGPSLQSLSSVFDSNFATWTEDDEDATD